MQSKRAETRQVLCVAAMLISTGCASWREGSTLHENQSQLRPAKNGGSGAKRLEIESAYDATVRAFVEQNGEPDYIYVIDRRTLQLVYVESQRVVRFERPWLSSESQATVTVGSDALQSVYHQGSQEAASERAATQQESVAPGASSTGSDGGFWNQHPIMRGIAEQLGGALTGAVSGGDSATIERYWGDIDAAKKKREQEQQAATVEAHASVVNSAAEAYASDLESFAADYNGFQSAVESFAHAQDTFRFNLTDRQVALSEAAIKRHNGESLARFLRALTAEQRTDLQALADTWQALSERGTALAARAQTLQARATALQMAQNEQALEAIELHARWAAQEQEEMTRAIQETARAVRDATRAAQQEADAERLHSDMQQFQLIQELRRLSMRPFQVPRPN